MGKGMVNDYWIVWVSGESLLDSMGTWDSKCVWDMIWLYDTIGF